MKNFWALPAFLRLALASQHSFSVFDDLLAFPQYEVLFPDTYLTEDEAAGLLARSGSHIQPSTLPQSQETQELTEGHHQSHAPPADIEELEHTYEPVVLDGRRYICSIPIIVEDETVNATASAEQAKAEEEKELVRAADRGWELLDGMKDSCIYYIGGWWAYSFCYQGEIKQFHPLPPGRGVPHYPPAEDAAVNSFVLGKFPKPEDGSDQSKASKETQKTLGKEEGTKETMDDEGNIQKPKTASGSTLEVARLETKGSSRYMVQRISGGTECDLTGKERKVEVQYHCHPQSADRIAMIKETATCTYLMIVNTPRLCNDVAFLPPQENLAHTINCQPVVQDFEAEAWEMVQVEDKLAEAERIIALENQNPLREIADGAEGSTKRGPIVGGIEVGAQKFVGSEGKVIEKSVVVGGGKKTHLATIATSSGEQLSVAEMKKLDIKNPKDVERLKTTIKKRAGKKAWKLELIETPLGREFVAVIEIEDQEDVEKKAKDGRKEDGESPKGKTSSKAKAKAPDSEEWQGAEDQQEGSEEIYKDEL
ncbi:hypothetical protein BU24DRAFT_427827 [Aaosphaeria arxii CBS 175.79]|uniref:Endoplasmic reticulum lectin n=1 Tax=Aaosphaeria arxii CBS 175.79 TaxID=1450172 RepID=A0A6A5X9S6_9PLEO|nr:uncharacterized protein BU24DRAFT_427827 [Aaosphaeria arxii CBS 175.79]KAF2009805.1 hypothetical protein BU24DRAFT_427827 [Aaosphaeria arxii CBS 175.79]